MYTLEFGASSCDRTAPLDRTVFESYAKNGIRFMEFSQKETVLPLCSWRDIRRASEETGVDIWSFHLPFNVQRYNIAAMDSFLRRMTVKEQENYLEIAAFLGAKYAVIHPSSEPIADADRAEAKKYSKENLSRLADKAEACGIVLAVENLPRTCLGNTASELLDLVHTDDRLRVCFDVNHLLKDTHENFVRLLGDKIVTLHISDYDFIDERHQLPGCGKIDWKAMLDLLESARYTGPFLYEVGMRDTEDSDPARAAKPTLADGAANCRAVMERKI